MKTYRRVLTHPLFISYSLCNLLTYGALFSWACALPIVFQHTLGFSAKTYGLVIFITSMLGCLLGSSSNAKLSGWMNPQLLIQFGWILVGLSGVLMYVLTHLLSHQALSILIALGIFQFGTAFVWPYTFIGAFKPFGDIAGYASALFAATQLLGGFILGALIAYLPDHNADPVSFIFIAVAIICLSIYRLVAMPLTHRFDREAALVEK